jgi:hypothetical protein
MSSGVGQLIAAQMLQSLSISHQGPLSRGLHQGSGWETRSPANQQVHTPGASGWEDATGSPTPARPRVSLLPSGAEVTAELAMHRLQPGRREGHAAFLASVAASGGPPGQNPRL